MIRYNRASFAQSQICYNRASFGSSLFHGTERTGATPYNKERTEIRGNVSARSMSTVLKVSACPLAIFIPVELLQFPPENSVSTTHMNIHILYTPYESRVKFRRYIEVRMGGGVL